MKSSCMLIGCSGLGVEIAKNIILAGISKLQLIDPTPPNEYDLGGNFYLHPHHIVSSSSSSSSSSQSRANLCVDALAELNPYVKVSVESTITDLTNTTAVCNAITQYQPTIVTITIPLPEDVICTINDYCRTNHICFIYTVTMSVFGQIFVDFGTSFTISDTDGEPPASSQIESVIVMDEDDKKIPVIKVLEDHGRHGLETNDIVTFSRLRGIPTNMIQNDVEYIVTVTGPYTFKIQPKDTGSSTNNIGPHDTAANNSEHINQQGYITQVKQPKTISHIAYRDAIATNSITDLPDIFMISDFAKMDHPAILHLGFRAILQYLSSTSSPGVYPVPGDTETIGKVLAIAQQLDTTGTVLNLSNTDADNENKVKVIKLLSHLISGSCAVLSPMCAQIGGIVGQEVLKACSKKFTPISGFLYLDAIETLPDTVLDPSYYKIPSTDSNDKDTVLRYASQIAVFGYDIQQRMNELQYFLIGAGAIGCEMLKNWAMMGVGCSNEGHVYVTDMDRIEKSNLSRQFLFRNTDINEFKSTTAANAIKVMNPTMNITAYQEKVAAETEHIFGDNFYDQLSGVCTALDNVEARLYVDKRCLFYRLPMLESGTLGTKGNTQVVVPHITENYGATRDPPEKSIPVCTLKNFPNQIQHTLQWARDWFEGEFKQCAEDVNVYLSATDSTQYLESLQPNTKVETLKTIHRILKEERPNNFEDCITWARLTFENLFHNQIRQLLYNFPEDQVTSTGTKFWSGSKRCPKALQFDINAIDDDAGMRNHFDFIVAAANLRAEMYGITENRTTDEEFFLNHLANVIVPDFVPADNVKIAANDEEMKQENTTNNNEPMDTGDSEVDDLWNSLPRPGDATMNNNLERLHPIEFDKDIDEHMLFVTACSNLRAMNYSIPTEDTHRSRAIAGRIIPAIATTTALVTGLICLELYKIVGTARKSLSIDTYKNGFVNLATPFMTFSEPSPPAKTKIVLQGKEWEWTAWDSLDMNLGDITLGEFMEHFEKEYNLEINMLSYNVSILYSFFANPKKVEERKLMKMTEVITSITKKEFPPNQLFIILEVIANDKNTDEEVELPYIKFRFR
jgi:ubiquitin-activating enzyme E1